MAKPGAQVTVTTEVGYCPFCRRSRTLRREERHLGGLVRTNIDCESCHRTLSSTMGVPQPAAEEAAPVEEAAAPAEPVQAPEPGPKAASKAKPATRAAAKKAAPRKTAATKKSRA
jgi:hypothetical protein